MTMTDRERYCALLDLSNNLNVIAYTLRAERHKFSGHLLRSKPMLHVYETLSEIARTLEAFTTILHDCNFLKGVEVDEMEKQIGRQAASPASASAAGPAEKTTDSKPAGQEGPLGISQEQQRQFDGLAGTLAHAISESLKRTAVEQRAILIDAIVAALGIDEITFRMDRFEEQLEGLNVIDVRLEKIDQKLILLEKWCGARQLHLELIEKKFAGIGAAIGVIAKSIPKTMHAAGNNGDDQPNIKQGD